MCFYTETQRKCFRMFSPENNRKPFHKLAWRITAQFLRPDGLAERCLLVLVPEARVSLLHIHELQPIGLSLHVVWAELQGSLSGKELRFLGSLSSRAAQRPLVKFFSCGSEVRCPGWGVTLSLDKWGPFFKLGGVSREVLFRAFKLILHFYSHFTFKASE